ncbi:hypothetical protein LTR86_005818 [Recurvomyces mirabilis]|nr:hypothetical protein LTR86_005818 [Recurvomyces mirabilis]
MVKATRPPANGFVAMMRRLYNPLGFSKGYNFIFWFISMGYLFGFTLARLQYLSFYGVFCSPTASGGTGASPGECFYYLRNPFKIGMMLHLFCILPAAVLVVLQFIPAIRHKAILFHRLNGYAVVALSLIANAGALIVLEHAFGGDFTTRVWGGTLVISTTVSYIMAYINIKLLQIDQHRAWMMRAWAYFSTIITIRLIMIISANIFGSMHAFFAVYPCEQINFVMGEQGTLKFYPGCASYYDGSAMDQKVRVRPNFNGTDPMEIAASLGVAFGTAGWLAFVIHAVIIEVYLRLTPAESERLRQVSYERQLARGFKRPGYAGLVAERFGDANPFVPASTVEERELSDDSGHFTLPDPKTGVHAA